VLFLHVLKRDPNCIYMKKPNFQDLIIFENENYLVISKPYDVATLDERDLSRYSILRLAREFYPDMQVCHRLDKETSGVLALAKHPEAYRHLSIQFEKRKVAKIYHAMVNGIHDFKEKVIAYSISPSGKSAVRLDALEGKKSKTIFDTLETYKKHTLVQCRPVTGRMHQIRIHLAAIKANIVADVLYGGKYFYLSEIKKGYRGKPDLDEEPFMKRVALHAYSLTFTDLDETVREIIAPYPKDFNAMVRQLEKNR
jgi:23S rRNA pseudouridine955/2504/2580 synthase